MKPSTTLSTVLLGSCVVFSGLIGHYLYGNSHSTLLFCVGGICLGLAALSVMRVWLRQEFEQIVGGAIGATVGGILAVIVYSAISDRIEPREVAVPIYILLLSVLSLVGMQVGSLKARERKRQSEQKANQAPGIAGILDTSVIIDGRIADICETGFVTGDLIIPEFVLKELQAIADSSETTRRTRGRRGLDILNKIRKQSYVNIVIETTDYPSIKEVDQKLIRMAKETGYAILTNDFNLNKVAEVHAVQVLNINQLANALKPVVLPGEHLHVQILKEGKEPSQGVAYLDDGTMVVVDHGRSQLGKTVEATVTSVLQTAAGRMIFAVIKEEK